MNHLTRLQFPFAIGIALACVALGASRYLAAPVPVNSGLFPAEGPKIPPGLVPIFWPKDNPYSSAKAELGWLLYFDKRLSVDGTVSCASCHADGRTDSLGWDLGSPNGFSAKYLRGFADSPSGATLIDLTNFLLDGFTPNKGPMVTQTLQGIIGNEPFHWRGEKDSLAEFNPAFTNLQGRDSEITPQEMALLEDFVASITYPPNPNRNIDNTLRTTLPVTGGNGNPQNGRQLYLNAPLLVGGLTCVACHALRVQSPVVARPIGVKNRGQTAVTSTPNMGMSAAVRSPHALAANPMSNAPMGAPPRNPS